MGLAALALLVSNAAEEHILHRELSLNHMNGNIYKDEASAF